MNLRDYVKQCEKPGRLISRDEMSAFIAAHQAIAFQDLAKYAACIADQLREIALQMPELRKALGGE